MKYILTAALFTLVTAPALAETPADTGIAALTKDFFAKADANKDGTVSKAEYEDHFAKQVANGFVDADSNKDGKITTAELTDAYTRRNAAQAAEIAKKAGVTTTKALDGSPVTTKQVGTVKAPAKAQ